MRSFLLSSLAVLTLLPPAAGAQYNSQCRTDAWGNVRCFDSGGNTLNIRNDGSGTTRSTYYGPSGNTTCTTRTRDWGLSGINTTTNCY